MRVRARDLFLVPVTLIITIAGLVWGGRNTYISIRNRAPVELTCAEYLAHRPEVNWVILRDCEADWDHIGIEGQVARGSDKVSTATAIYIPLRPTGGSRAQPSQLVLHSDSSRFLVLGSGFPSQQAVDDLGAELSRPLEGIVELAVDRSERRKERLRRLDLVIADDFVTFDLDARPRPLWLALGALAFGLGGLGLIVRRVRRWLRGGSTALPRATVRSS